MFRKPEVRASLLIAALSLAYRLALLPFATIESADSVSRTWKAWAWLADPHIISHGFWGPLHTYLIAFALTVYPDPLLSPLLLHVAFGAATPVLLYLWIRREFTDQRTAIFIALAYVFIPVAVNSSISALAEAPTTFLVLLSLIFLSAARAERGRRRPGMLVRMRVTLSNLRARASGPGSGPHAAPHRH